MDNKILLIHSLLSKIMLNLKIIDVQQLRGLSRFQKDSFCNAHSRTLNTTPITISGELNVTLYTM